MAPNSPGANTRPFVAIVVDVPLLQSFTLVLAIVALCLELPASFVSHCTWPEGR